MLNVVFRRAALRARVPLFRLACVWALLAPTAHAAEPPSPEPAASAPFKHYQGWRDEPLQDWREVNDRVGEIGGWRTYLREAQQGGDTPGDSGHMQQDQHGH